jgi:hypothetical protein
MSYGSDQSEHGRIITEIADKIMKGSKRCFVAADEVIE